MGNNLPFHVRNFAEVGASEPFVSQMLELTEVAKATLIFGEVREQLIAGISGILTEGLIPAFMELRKIRASVGKALPIVEERQIYEDFAAKLWKSYKELMQRTAKLAGFDIGFLFQKESHFNVGLKKFRADNPGAIDSVEAYLGETRRLWHTDLANFRNTITQHPDGNRAAFAKFYEPRASEVLFRDAWDAIVQILAMLLGLRLPPGVFLIEQDPKDAGPRWPQRFRYEVQQQPHKPE